MSRYYDYDYDRNCIIGFGSDEDDKLSHSISSNSIYNLDLSLSPASSQSGDSFPNPQDLSLSPSISTTQQELECYQDTDSISALSDECITDDDIIYILQADTKAIKQQKLKPLNVDVPFLLVGDMLKQRQFEEKEKALSNKNKGKVEQSNKAKENSNRQNKPKSAATPIALGFGDTLNVHETDCNLWIQNNGTNVSPNAIPQCQQIQRVDDYNGSYYNTFGSNVVSKNQCHVWRLQLFGNAPAIIGIIESEAPQQVLGAYFGHDKKYKAYSFNTITAATYESTDKSLQPIYQQMLQSGRLDKPMIIDCKLDLYRGTMSIANVTPGCMHYGKEIFLFDKIDTDKQYKLGLALLGPEIINLF